MNAVSCKVGSGSLLRHKKLLKSIKAENWRFPIPDGFPATLQNCDMLITRNLIHQPCSKALQQLIEG